MSVRGGALAPSALTVSKCENFDPLKRAEKSVFGPKKPVFLHTHQKIHQKLTVRGGNPYGQSDRKISLFYDSPIKYDI